MSTFSCYIGIPLNVKCTRNCYKWTQTANRVFEVKDLAPHYGLMRWNAHNKLIKNLARQIYFLLVVFTESDSPDKLVPRIPRLIPPTSPCVEACVCQCVMYSADRNCVVSFPV